MPLWHCPHCGTPQPESARCWVCRKSSTSCATCRHFRHAVAGQLGYCGLDRRRQPLRGDEMRGCWEGAVIGPIGIGARTAEALAPFRPSIAWTDVDAAPPGAEVAAHSIVATVTPATTADPGPIASTGVARPTAPPDPPGESAVGPEVGAAGAEPPGADAASPGLWSELDL